MLRQSTTTIKTTTTCDDDTSDSDCDSDVTLLTDDLCDAVRPRVEEPRPLLIVVSSNSGVLDSVAGDAVERRRVPRHLD